MSPKPGVRIFAKLEGLNPSGSIKDRVAKYLVQQAEESGALTPGQTLVEASTGNTALALALIAKQKGYKLKVVIPHRATPGVADLLATYGAEIVWCDPLAGMRGAIELARQLGQEEGYFNTRQFESEANINAHYETTGLELLRDLPNPDVFIAGIGTGGTLMGVGRRLKERNREIRVIGVEPRMGEQLQGLRSLEEGYIPPVFDESVLDGRMVVDSATSFRLTRELTEKTGVFAGVSSGSVVRAAQIAAQRMTSGKIVCLLADNGWKYLSSGLWTHTYEEIEEDVATVLWW